MGLYNLVSLLGIICLISLAYLFCENKKQVNWHVVVWGLGLQLLFAWFLFISPAGVKFFLFVNDVVVKVLDSSLAGSNFLFGRLALPPGASNEAGETSLGFILAFQALPTIIFFSALMSILYFFNILPKIIKLFAYLFTKLMKVSGAESLCAASNIFVGVESALTVKPYLKNMTRSELCTVLTAGMATVSSNILAVYVFSLKEVFPNIAGHLVSASLLSAPAALAMSKLMIPETEQPETLGDHIEPHIVQDDNLFEAIINGSMTGARLIVGIVALLIAVLGLVALMDQLLIFAGNHINQFFTLNIDWTLKGLLGYLFYPLTIMIGIAPHDAAILSKIIGERAIVTELTAYQDLAVILSQDVLRDPRSAVITTYALCGFAHVASMAIFIGGITAIVPEKTRMLSEIGFKALIAATLACLLTASVAGLFFVKGSYLLGS